MIPHDLKAVAFPRLADAQMAAMGSCPLTTLRSFKAGQKLFEACTRDALFFVIKVGEVVVLDESGDEPRVVRVSGPGDFIGELAQLTGGRSLVSAVAQTDCEVYEVSPDALKRLINDHPDLGDMILQAFLARRQLLREPGALTGLRVIGSRYSQDTFRVRDFLTKNRQPYTWLDLEGDPGVMELLKQFQVSEADTPVVAWGRKLILRNPSNSQLAETLGLRALQEHVVHDLVVVGAGPAGLAAAVYGASEGLKTLVLERTAPGGQAGRSMRIENYFGFATGITGAELTERAVVQANKFGALLPVGTSVTVLSFDNAYSVLHLEGGDTVTAKCLLIATGADYRLLSVPGCAQYEGRGVYYAATAIEAQICRGSVAVVVGGGNSAGQAAVFLSSQLRTVYLVVRGDSLYKNMSSYLAQRIEDTANVKVYVNSEVRRLSGGGYLCEVEIVNNKTGEVQKLECPAVFSFIGAVPRTEWLPVEIEKDAKGFIRTGPELAQSPHWRVKRQPFLLETSRRGVFAAGDARSGSVKRVAAAVGEGSMAVQLVHEYLKEM